MSYGLLLLSAALTCVSARFTVPVPIHYEIEAQFQKQTTTKMRWDPTNYLTYLAAVYSQCSHLYPSQTLQTRGRVPNATAYANLQIYFDSSLLQNNLAVFAWDIVSDSYQDVGTVDRDLRRLFGKSNGAGPLNNIANVDSSLRNYDRFGCSVETICRQQQVTSVMTFVCVFGQSVVPRQVSGTGGSQPVQPAQPVQTAQPARPTAARFTAATTTRPRARPTAAPRQPTGGLYESFGSASSEHYETITNEFPVPEIVGNYSSPDVVQYEQRLSALGLCKYENDASAFTANVLRGSFGNDVLALLYGAVPDTMPTAQDMTADSEVGMSAIRSATGLRMDSTEITSTSVACAWAICSQKVMVGCAAWGVLPEDGRKSS